MNDTVLSLPPHHPPFFRPPARLPVLRACACACPFLRAFGHRFALTVYLLFLFLPLLCLCVPSPSLLFLWSSSRTPSPFLFIITISSLTPLPPLGPPFLSPPPPPIYLSALRLSPSFRVPLKQLHHSFVTLSLPGYPANLFISCPYPYVIVWFTSRRQFSIFR